MKVRGVMLLLLVWVDLAAQPTLAKAQSRADSGGSSGTVASTPPAQLEVTYMRPTKATKLRNYLFDAFGPYPIAGAAPGGICCREHRPGVSL